MKPVSGWTEAALDEVLSPSPFALGLALRSGVPTRAGTGVGEGALLAESGVAAEATGADDCWVVSVWGCRELLCLVVSGLGKTELGEVIGLVD